MRRLLLCFLLLWASAVAGFPQDDEAAVRAVISEWYAELAKKDAARPERLVFPGYIEASPYYEYPDNGSAAMPRPFYTSLAASALRFRFEVEELRIDPSFARAEVWERGYFYAYAAQQTYELASAASFILERKSGRWLIRAHRSETTGIPPDKVSDPMPDLRDLYYATEGKNRNPGEDARNAGKF